MTAQRPRSKVAPPPLARVDRHNVNAYGHGDMNTNAAQRFCSIFSRRMKGVNARAHQSLLRTAHRHCAVLAAITLISTRSCRKGSVRAHARPRWALRTSAIAHDGQRIDPGPLRVGVAFNRNAGGCSLRTSGFSAQADMERGASFVAL